MPFTLEIDPVPAGDRRARRRARRPSAASSRRVCRDAAGGACPPDLRARAHLARAMALDPKLLRARTSDGGVADGRAVGAWRGLCRGVARPRRWRRWSLTQDLAFAEAVAHRRWLLQPATGALVPWKVKRGLVLGERYCFVITPQATLGPPLTPDFGSPVMPWSGLP